MTLTTCPESLTILRHLVAFDTTSRNSNLELIEYVKARLGGLSIPFRLTYDGDGRKANLLATLGPSETPGGYVLSGRENAGAIIPH